VIRGALVVTLAWGLVACSHEPGQQRREGAAAGENCVPGTDQGNWRARWQAETAPVINKRQGQDALDNDEADAAEAMVPCP